ncbi:hypothetical protein PLANPX_1036 [Lacipirellula parvula]|uniref:Uncharacterized protein n=1 Tax=Lacipirellula parvula TaxID=2650471 RepID=A0A5K7X434_9BACT|nr:hypothetical protein PLANPX_1036 [Lacipirellula parvula]
MRKIWRPASGRRAAKRRCCTIQKIAKNRAIFAKVLACCALRF